MAASVDNSAWLQWMASLMGGARQNYAATLPSNRYYCLLDDVPLHLIPRPARHLLHETVSSGLVLNPECSLGSANEPPNELRARKDLLSGFAQQGTIAWVRESDTGLLLPYWVGPQMEALVRRLQAKEVTPEAIPPAIRALLKAAAILIPAERSETVDADSVRRTREQFEDKGYAVLPQLLHPFQVAALRRYYRQQIRSGAISLGDRQSAKRYVAHNEPVARFFHHQVAKALSRVAGRPLKPSYVYFASYMSGAELLKHTDREQCDFSITFSLDYSPEPRLATPWPISLETKAGPVTVYQALGDGLAYRGMQLPHYRGKLSGEQTSTSLFFHYVAEEYTGSLD